MTDVFASSVSAATTVSELYAENIIAKALRIAQTAVGALPFAFPEIVPQTMESDGTYNLREANFWTCGFFPGTLYLLLERLIRFPQSINLDDSNIRREDVRSQLTTLCRTWSEPIRGMDTRTDTHDIGFIVMPALRLDWELFGNTQSLESIVRAAHSLATRYVPSAKAIRSWDLLKKKDIEILDQTDNMIVIIDSMCNLDLLYYASHHGQHPSLADLATAHALTLLGSHLRPEPVLSSSKDAYSGQWYSTCHVANIDPKTGELKRRLSAQGYAHESTWSRGQAWGILGYAETYAWTKDRRFLEASCGLAEYFLYRLETAPSCVSIKGRHVPLWDFDAPIEDEESPLRDSSAGVIAANGMLVLSQALATIDQPALSLRYRNAALRIVRDILDFALAPEKARLVSAPYQHVRAEEERSGVRFDGMLKFGTANNNAQARKRYANHGLVYGDYYLVEFGNRLLRMGLH
ncbi:glycoside hydrolase family 88 protein [Macroventuria anomochaeta]|uniref:Glycoside hydrolase family 88 protein n=1 Tax=Macroventuria anomochaeta TaxID=301207 RepID=A0ACB6RI22_9PLEO|nr:glycoside hydrolase family 88 protein [Macroventuria anomochaeta]KAF2621347.1 glycoside hydrolase family 88 protein [Macroventuria anomochaeta]